MRSPAAKSRKPRIGPVASTIAASADALEGATRPTSADPDLDMIGRVVSGPAWQNVGLHVRLAWAALTSETRGSAPLSEIVAEMMDNSKIVFEDDLVRIGQTRIALMHVVAMMTASVRAQWKAVDAWCISKGMPAPSAEADDELLGDDDLLALRPVFEMRCEAMRVATEAVAKADKGSSTKAQAAAHAAQNAAIDADREIVERITMMRARTKEGVQFKREVRAYWDDCEQRELDESIFADLLAYVEASP